jgi:predicted DsbA family dithiol-disulfide isomerase
LVDVNDVVLEEGRIPLHPTAYKIEHLDWPQVAALTDSQSDALMGALNQLTGPCSPCWEQGKSYVTCLRDRPEICEGVQARLLERGAHLAAAGARTDAIRSALQYDDAWFPIDWQDLGAIAAGWGPSDAAVRVVLVVDLQSPFCAQTADSWQKLLELGGDNVAVRILYWSEKRHLRSRPAALAAEAAAAQGQQWAYTRLLLSRYHHLEDSDLMVAAAELGLDAEAFERVRSDLETGQRLNAQQALAEELGVRSAPTVFVDGFRQRGARPYTQLSSLMVRALADQGLSP